MKDRAETCPSVRAVISAPCSGDDEMETLAKLQHLAPIPVLANKRVHTATELIEGSDVERSISVVISLQVKSLD